MMQTTNDFSVIAALELDSIKAKLMHVKGGKGWSLERASAVEREYRRFLYLMKKFPNEPTAPVVDVDTFWHYHILDTMKYAADCQKVFGHFLHHFPYVGMRGKEDEEALKRMGERMRTIYEETFQEDYLAAVAAAQPMPRTAMSTGVDAGVAYRPRAVSEQAAYCTMRAAEAAYCTVTSEAAAEAAYCTVTSAAEAAYCTVTSAAAGEPAYCTRAIAEAAYCTVTQGAPDCGQPTTSSAQKRRADAEGLQFTLPEQRAGFYLERPRLPSA